MCPLSKALVLESVADSQAQCAARAAISLHACGGNSASTGMPSMSPGVSRGVVAAVSVKPAQSIVASSDAPTSRINVTVPASRFGPSMSEAGFTQTSSGRISRRMSVLDSGTPRALRNHDAPAARQAHAAGAIVRDRQDIAETDEVGDELADRIAIDVERLADLRDAAFFHHDDFIGHRHRFALVVRDHDRRDAEALLQQADFHLHRFAQLGVERGERLVEQQQFRLRRDRARNRHALTLAAGELRDRPVRHMRQLDQLQQFGDAARLLLLRGLAQLQRIRDVLRDRHVRKQRERLEHHAEVALVRRQPRDVAAGEMDAARGRRFEAGDHPQQGGLAAAGRPEKAHQLAVGHAQIDVVDGMRGAEAAGHGLQGQMGHRRLQQSGVGCACEWAQSAGAIKVRPLRRRSAFRAARSARSRSRR